MKNTKKRELKIINAGEKIDVTFLIQIQLI